MSEFFGDRGGWSASGGLRSTLALAAALFVVALATRVALIAYPPIYDELYQMLPAQSYWRQGDFAVLDGIYDRAALFSRLIAFSFGIFGDDGVVAARLIPSALPGALLVAIVFAWTRATVGVAAGWFVAVFLLLWPNGIEVSQYVRFYALQGLLFVSGALAVYAALILEIRTVWRAAGLAAAAVLFGVALRLQLMTLVGVVGLGVWIAATRLPVWLRAEPRLWWLLGAAALAGLAVIASGVVNETLGRLWAIYNWEPWPPLRDTFIYHRNFRDNYPTFWPLFPVAALIALAARPKPAAFCALIFAVSFALQSFGGLKNIRYLYPAMPFFFVIWAIALQAVIPVLTTWLRRVSEAGIGIHVPRALVGVGVSAALLASALFLFAANAAFERAARLTMGQPPDVLLGKTRWAWPEVADLAEPWIAENAVVVTSEEMLAIEWLGDFDIAYNRPRFSELQFGIGPDVAQFTRDRRTDRPLVGDFASLLRVVSCEPVGIFLANLSWARGGGGLALLQAARDSGADAKVETGPGVALLGWRRDAPLSSEECAGVSPPADDRAATRLRSGLRQPAHVSVSAADER